MSKTSTKGERCLLRGRTAGKASTFSGDTKTTNLIFLDFARLHLEGDAVH